MNAIRVVVADDHELVRYALRTMIDAETDLEVVGDASDCASAVALCAQTRPNVLVLDSCMPGEAGADVCDQIRTACPETAILVLASHEEGEELFEILSAGACGYLLKDTRPVHIIHAIRAVADGQTVLDATIVDRVVNGRRRGNSALADPLSGREMEVLALMGKGLSNKEIGRTLWIGETTVKTHVSHILRKLGQGDRTQAVLEAVRSGLIELGR